MVTAVELLEEVRANGYESGKPVYSKIVELIRRGSKNFISFDGKTNTLDNIVASVDNAVENLPSEKVCVLFRFIYDNFVALSTTSKQETSLLDKTYERGASKIRGMLVTIPPKIRNRLFKFMSDTGEKQRELAIIERQITAEQELLALYFKASLAENDMEETISHLGF